MKARFYSKKAANLYTNLSEADCVYYMNEWRIRYKLARVGLSKANRNKDTVMKKFYLRELNTNRNKLKQFIGAVELHLLNGDCGDIKVAA